MKITEIPLCAENIQKMHEFLSFVGCIKIFVASLDSTAETGHANGADWQEEIYQKVIFVIYCSCMSSSCKISMEKVSWNLVQGSFIQLWL